MRRTHLPRDSYNRNAYISTFRGKSLRLPGHDYSAPGIYHIITCAKGIGGRGPLFQHPVLRQLLQTNWLDLPLRFPSIHLEGLVIMPDHIHFIIWMNKWPERLHRDQAPYLWQVMQAYKSKVAVEWLDHIKANHPNWSAKIWQGRYYDRIMRSGELERARLYIRENPDKQEQSIGCEAFYEHMVWKKPF